jgi:DNA-binding NarL/FixJ family response regulator
MPVMVLVVDDDEDTRWLLAATLRGNPGVTVVGSAGDGEEAVAFVRHERPDIVLMDPLIPRLDGLVAAQRIKREWPNTKVIVLGVLAEEAYQVAASINGADRFLKKAEIAAALLPAVRDVTGRTAGSTEAN